MGAECQSVEYMEVSAEFYQLAIGNETDQEITGMTPEKLLNQDGFLTMAFCFYRGKGFLLSPHKVACH